MKKGLSVTKLGHEPRGIMVQGRVVQSGVCNKKLPFLGDASAKGGRGGRPPHPPLKNVSIFSQNKKKKLLGMF